MSDKLSRRELLKLFGFGVGVLTVQGCSGLNFDSTSNQPAAPQLSDMEFKNIAPIDRSLPQVAAKKFSGDEPSRAHHILWDKSTYMATLPSEDLGKLTKHALVIVGGGISGLLSAYQLRAFKPVVLEQAPRFGGNSRGEAWQGIDYSIGAAYIANPSKDAEIMEVLKALDLDRSFRVSEEGSFVYQGKRYQGFWDGVTDPASKKQFHALKEYFLDVLNERNGQVFPQVPSYDADHRKLIDQLDRESFKARLEKVAGGTLHPHIDRAMEHYCWSSFGSPFGEVSAAAGLNFYAAEFDGVAVFPGGNACMTERLLAKLRGELPASHLRAKALVFDIQATERGNLIRYQDAEGKVQALLADVVVMACPKFIANKLVTDFSPERQAAIAKLRYHSYLVANVMIDGPVPANEYDLYMLGANQTSADIEARARRQKVTDVIVANFSSPHQSKGVLTLYRGIPYDGARPELYQSDIYPQIAKEFKQQLEQEVLPLFKLKPKQVVDLRLTRWGHPLPSADVNLIADRVVDAVHAPIGERMFFIEQDNWMLPAFETAIAESLHWCPQIRRLLS